MRSPIMAIGAMALLSAVALGVPAGPLDPPGAPGATRGPEPRTAIDGTNTPGDGNSQYRIASSGSYYLAGNITLGSALSGIEIGASHVTLDLNGFTIGRSAIVVDEPLSGIVADGSQTNIVIRNGTVRDFSQHGISFPTVTGSTLENISAVGNGGNGIWINSDSMIRDCMVRGNDGTGIRTGNRCQVVRCTAVANGVGGIYVEGGSEVRECLAHANAADGIEMLNATLCISNYCEGNGSRGIRATGGGHRIEGNLMRSNVYGLTLNSTTSLIIGNSAVNNSTAAYSIPVGNFTGPLITSSANVPTANAWANFSY